MRLVVSYCGREIEVKQTLWQFQTYVRYSLRYEHFLDCVSLATGILYDSLICITKNGVQVNETVMDDLLQHERETDLVRFFFSLQEFYVFDRELLYVDVNVIVPQLEIEYEVPPTVPPPQLPPEPLQPSLDALLVWARNIRSTSEAQLISARELHGCIERIHASTCVGLANLQTHTETIKLGARKLDELAAKELAEMNHLLQRYELDLFMLSRITINSHLLIRASNTSEPKTLGSFVDADAIHRAARSGKSGLDALQDQYTRTCKTESQLSVDLADLVTEVEHTHLKPSTDTMEQMEQASSSINDIVQELESRCLLDDHEWPMVEKLAPETVARLNHQAELVQSQFAIVMHCLNCLTSDRNALVHRHLNLVQDISSLQSDYAELGGALAHVDAELTSPKLDGFKQLLRLKKMLWAYGATLVEGVRRSEFTRLFLDKAQRLAELMAKFAETELVVRNEYVTLAASQLPFEVAIDAHPPIFDVSSRQRDSEKPYAFTRKDIDVFYAQLDMLAADVQESYPDQGKKALEEVRTELQPLVIRLDHAEETFSTLAQREFQLNDDESEGSEERSHSPSSLQQTHEVLQRQLLLAQQHSRDLEEELARRAAEWSKERQALQRAADMAENRPNAGIPKAPMLNRDFSNQLESLLKRVASLQVDDTQALYQIQSDLEHMRDQFRSGAQDWQLVPSLLAQLEELRQYLTTSDTFHPRIFEKDKLSESQTRRKLPSMEPVQFVKDVCSQLEWLAAQSHLWEQVSKSMQDKNTMLATAARERIAVRDFAPGCLALFLPTQVDKHWAALHVSDIYHFLRMTDELFVAISHRPWLIARITHIETCVAQAGSGLLAPGTVYYWLDVEDWDAPVTRCIFPRHRLIYDPTNLTAEGRRLPTSRKSSATSCVSSTTAPWQPRADVAQDSDTLGGTMCDPATQPIMSPATQALSRIQRVSSAPGMTH